MWIKVNSGQKTVNMNYNQIDKDEQMDECSEFESAFQPTIPQQIGQTNNRLNQKIVEIEERAVKLKNPHKFKPNEKGQLIR